MKSIIIIIPGSPVTKKNNPVIARGKGGRPFILAIPEHKLSAYYDVLQLIINQTLAQLEKRPEDAHRVMLLIDELPRILSAGKIERLLDGARTLRSRNVTLILVAREHGLMDGITRGARSEINER